MKYMKDYWDDVSRVVENIPKIEQLYGKRILFTGATGMVCSSIIDVIVWLNNNRGANISLILAGRDKERIDNRFIDILKPEDYVYLEYDATKYQLYDIPVDYIIHGASNANPAIYAKEPVETLIGNIVGLQSVLDTARGNKNSRLLYISSSEVYGNRIANTELPFKEEDYGYIDILNPRASYPSGKRAAETLCSCYGSEYGVDSVIVRLGHIYGPTITESDTRASASFTRDVLNGRDIVMKSNGEQLRSYCFTLDCASAILTVLINGEKTNAYNISNKDSVVSIREMAEALAMAANVRVVYSRPTEKEIKSYNLMKNSSLDATKLESLGWKAVYNINEGMKLTIKYGG